MSRSVSRRQFLSLAGASATVLAGLGLAACGGSSSDSSSTTDSSSDSSSSETQLSGSITAVGSTALQPLVEAAAEQFMTEQPGVQITVQGGGSGQGITQIAQGSVQIGNSDVFAEEKLDNPDDASKLIDNKVAVVGMGPVVNTDVTVDDLTLDQLRDIFTGTVTNWSEVGGADEEIVVINRASGSGTRATFENAVLRGEEVPSDFTPQEQDSSGTVATMIAQTPGAISYLAFSYFADTFKALKVGGVEPTAENVETNDWTIWAYEHMYTSSDPDEATQAFIDYMLGDEVQGSLVEENGYIPISGMKVSRDADGNVTNL
ncbi:MAG: phosphate ABC transporter substrate-binding protein PstS family protein [Tractidigestivibacter sp.]|jgi:phosphate transport system substrate-binding protein|uniref:phosphate ABC transporter substrate-binding protein PstS family protein n=1 Tax=Tractidigestivibacter sp. TaxID=2847320 RepID=UPI003D9302A3